MSGSLFCEHKKLRTSCAACKAGAIPPPPADVKPFVTAEEREAKEERRAARETRAPPGAAEASEKEREAKTPRATGPGKPLMPTRPKKRGVSADEAAAATAWWVKK